jgi:Xaa-Pro aminopeptidase
MHHPFEQRRERLMNSLPANSIALIPSASEVLRNGMDRHYTFRQNSDFYYLTGFNEPDAVCVLIPGRKAGAFILFNREKNPAEEIWTGRRAGIDGACKDFGADQAFAIDTFDTMLLSLLEGKQHLFYPISRKQDFDLKVLNAFKAVQAKVRKGIQCPQALSNIEGPLHQLRLIKDEAEIQCLRYASKASCQAHLLAMQACHPGVNEGALEAVITGHCAHEACPEMAYTSIVGAGENSCILHYTENNQPIKDGDIVLIDAGAEYQGYAADITRSFPANGKFTPEQRSIYQLVLKAQEAAISLVKPGTLWPDLQQAILAVIVPGLVELGILHGDSQQLIDDKAYMPYYMHLSGHWLGLDVHDAGTYYTDQQQWKKLEAGMVLTIEPGLYFSANTPDLDPRWWNIGIRIEDDILVTANGYENLSGALIKDPDAIEQCMTTQKAQVT